MPRKYSQKQSNAIVAEYTETYGKVLTDVLSTRVRDLTKLEFNKTELSTLIGTALVLEIDRPRLVECLKQYIPSQRMKWAREEQKAAKLGDDDFEERCPVLFGLLANENKSVKRKADATVAYASDLATDAQKVSIAGIIARGDAKIDARTARRKGQSTATQIRLIAPEIARSDAIIAYNADLATETQMRLLAPAHAKRDARSDAIIAYNADLATETQMCLLAPAHARRDARSDAIIAYNADLATETQMRLLAPAHARRDARILARLNELAEMERLEAANPSQDYVLSYNENSLDVSKLVLTEFWMDFIGVRDASKIIHKLHCFFHLTKVHPRNLQRLTSNDRKALMPGNRLTEDTIRGNDLLPPIDNPGVCHLQNVLREKLNKELWGHPSLIMCLLFFFRHHGRFYPFVAGQVIYAYCILKTNPKFKSFAQHKWLNQIANGCELLCKAPADVEPDACIQITIHEDGDAFGATYKLIRNSCNMEDAVDFDIR